MGRKGVAKATFETKHRDGEITSPAGTKVLGVDIFGPATRDPKRLVAFYQDVLGLTPTDIDENGSGAELADGTTFGVWQPPEAPTSGAGYVALFAVKDINAAVALFRSRGRNSTIRSRRRFAFCPSARPRWKRIWHPPTEVDGREHGIRLKGLLANRNQRWKN